MKPLPTSTRGLPSGKNGSRKPIPLEIVSACHCRRWNSTSPFVMLVLAAIAGCGKGDGNLITNPGFESRVTKSGLPYGWSFSVESGDYNFRIVNGYRFGKKELVIEGNGGTAELMTNVCSVPEGSMIVCEAWIHHEELKAGEVFLSAETQFRGDDQANESSPIAFSPKESKWQGTKSHVYVDDTGAAGVRVKIRVQGAVKVHLDNFSLKIGPQAERLDAAPDLGFEAIEDGVAPSGYQLHSPDSGASCRRVTKAPRSGKSCVRIQGAKGFGTLSTTKSLYEPGVRILVQGYMRVNSGRGHIKIDYYGGANHEYLGCTTTSDGVKGRWSLFSVETESDYVEQADSIRVALSSANFEGPYSVDFDDLEFFLIP